MRDSHQTISRAASHSGWFYFPRIPGPSPAVTHTLCVDLLAGHRSSRFYHSNTVFADTAAVFFVSAMRKLIQRLWFQVGNWVWRQKVKSEVRQNRLAIGSSCDGSRVNDSGDLTETIQPQGSKSDLVLDLKKHYGVRGETSLTKSSCLDGGFRHFHLH